MASDYFSDSDCLQLFICWKVNEKKYFIEYLSTIDIDNSKTIKKYSLLKSMPFDVLTNIYVPPLASDVPPLASVVPPLSSDVPPLASVVPPLASVVPPLASDVPPLSSDASPPLKPTISVNDIVVFHETVLGNFFHSVIINIPGLNGNLFEAAVQPPLVVGGLGTKMAKYFVGQKPVFIDITEYIYVPGTSEWKVYLPSLIKINIFLIMY